jgi:omega-hydroxy-beta-dihydromenaquinone-9 sulfotransferase
MFSNFHPLSGGSSLNLLSRALSYGVDFKYLPRFLSTLGISLVGAPSRLLSNVRFNSKIDEYSYDAEPVFILGHWRSGTTYLHHLISCDKRFSYVSSYQAAVPDLFLQDDPLTRAIVAHNLPKKRPMDNIELSLQNPEEEEVLMANTSPYSFIHTFSFPKQSREIFDKSVLFQGISNEEKLKWGQDYIRAMKIACLGTQTDRPLLKSPGNTARIKFLLELFPKAKFIHIYRNPYVVFSSTVYTYQKLMEAWKFQDISLADVEENVLYAYEQVMGRFFQDQSLIPPENLIEIRYEEFEQDQLNTLQKIYDQFHISDFDHWKDSFQHHISSAGVYKKNIHSMEPDVISKIYSRWSFAIDRWGYQPPQK